MAGNNDLEFLNPALASQWHPTKNGDLLPSHVTAASTKKIWWLCEADPRHEWETAVKTRHRGRGCPICSSHLLITGINDLATTNPALASEWNYELNKPLIPQMVARSANKKVWWTCLKNESHVYEASINARDNGKTGCPICASRVIVQGFNDAATHYPQLAEEWHPTLNGDLKWTDVSPMSNKSVWWICRINPKHFWETKVSSRTALGSGCQICNRKLIVSGLNDLATNNPELAAEWHPTLNKVSPDSVAPYCNVKYWWECPKNKAHIWEATPNARNGRGNHSGSGCPKCIFFKTESDFRNLFNDMTDLEFVDGKIPIKWSTRNLTQIDILNEDKKICIEYDGRWSHGGKINSPFPEEVSLARDVRKTKALLAAGYIVIRIREAGLCNLSVTDERFLQISFKEKEDKNPIVERCIEFYQSFIRI